MNHASDYGYSIEGQLPAATKQFTYTIVENAGYDGENDRMAGFNTAETAWRYAERIYRKREIESLHVQVRKDFSDGTQSYEY